MGLRTRYKAEIDAAATRYGLDPLLVEAVVVQESAGNTDAFRFEPMFWNRYLKGNPKYRHLNPRRVSSSYGLMQVMYCRLLEDKIADNDAWAPELLFVPENGLDIGCAFLAELLEWAKSLPVDPTRCIDMRTYHEEVALAAYNGGRGGNDPNKNWPLRNGKYAREVLAKREALAKEYSHDPTSGGGPLGSTGPAR
jgi:soluble lytic murein transglycosylase-like protein